MSDAPIRTGHPDADFVADTCGCCDGTALATIQLTNNRPNLAAIAFRVGDHGRFKASMLTGLASAAHPALQNLGTREDDDFSIALIDAWASACDVLTFYQERLANEAYIGTATERLSVGELARLIGYRLHPGAAAETDLVILMDDPPGAVPDVTDLLVPEGTRVQSQPGPDEMPQIFETIADLDARVAWNTFRPRLSQPILPGDGDSSTWVDGTPALAVGDALVFVSRERSDEAANGFSVDSALWDYRRVTAVEPFPALGRTRITWDIALNSVVASGDTPTAGLRLYHLPDRASFFGYNAPDPAVLSTTQRSDFGYSPGELPAPPPPDYPTASMIAGRPADFGDWIFTLPTDDQVWLDAIYKSFVEGSWVILRLPTGGNQLYRITSAQDDAVARYALSGKATRLGFDTDLFLSSFEGMYRGTSVYGGSIEVAFAETPLAEWVAGSRIDLDRRVDDLPEGRTLILRGKRARLEVQAQVLTLTPEDGAVQELLKGDHVTLMAEPRPVPATLNSEYDVVTDTGIRGVVVAIFGAMEAVTAPDAAEDVTVSVTLENALATGANSTRLVLEDDLPVAFDRTSLTIYGNVVRAAHGEGVTDILGSGDPRQPFQKFLLKQSPVTHRAAATETGIESTLTLRVDGAEWQEVPDLYDRGPTARVFKTSLTDAGETVVEFGDGNSGARPTAGRDNIVAEHSKGIGLAGNLRAGQLVLPLDRPLGLKDAFNPLPATGGDDAESQKDARRNAPIYTLTLGRVVSLTDYRDFALGFPGIAKAEARWVWQGETRRIVVTVAGPGGAEIPAGTTTYDTLLGAFRSLGDPLVGVDLLSYAPAFFQLGLRVAVDAAHASDTVLPAIEAAMRAAFSFDARDFAQTLALSEIAAVAHGVTGVQAVDVDYLFRDNGVQTAAIAYARLRSEPGRLVSGGILKPAEILMLSRNPLFRLEVMS